MNGLLARNLASEGEVLSELSVRAGTAKPEEHEAVAKLPAPAKSKILRPFSSGSEAATIHVTSPAPSGLGEEHGRKWLQKGDFAAADSFAIGSHDYLMPDPNCPLTTYNSHPYVETQDMREDVLLCQQIIEAKGMEMLVLDQTCPDIGMPVVYRT